MERGFTDDVTLAFRGFTTKWTIKLTFQMADPLSSNPCQEVSLGKVATERCESSLDLRTFLSDIYGYTWFT